MKKIICMSENVVKEYQLTYDSEEMISFLASLNQRTILPVQISESCDISEDMRSLYGIMYENNPFDKQNTLLTYEDIKAYIIKLHQADSLDLTPLYVLLNSNASMRNIEVYNLFHEFLNLYTYEEVFHYDAYYTSALLRKEYENNPTVSVPDCEIMNRNALALDELGFSIKNKIQEQQNHQKRYQ